MIYFIHAEGTDLVKIGYTEGDARKRLAQLQIGNPNKLVLLKVAYGDESEERALHVEFASIRSVGEWFKWTPALMVKIACMSDFSDTTWADWDHERTNDMQRLIKRIADLEEEVKLLRTEKRRAFDEVFFNDCQP